MVALRGALIGCGFFAVNQMHAWRDIEGAEIVAICDRDPERLKLVGDQFGVARRYADAAAMLAAEKLDFVDIATTVGSHRPLVEMAASHRVPVICQKPFAPTLDDAKAMVTACADAGVPLMVHENFRWQSPIQAVRAVLDSGEIGTPFFGRISFRSGYDVFSGQPYLATGKRFIIEDLGIHILDIARFLLGDVSSLTARTARINPAIAGEDVATMLMDHVGGATSVVDCSYATKLAVEPFPETLIELDGSDGTIRLAQGYQLTVTGKSGTTVRDVSPPLLAWASRPWHNIQESVLAIQKHWVDSLAAGKEPATSGADNLKTFALVEAAYAGAASRAPVQIDALLK
ncbi:MAG: Gfo/Idh/MocA family oxidoreductase [Mesorhizobium sp.]|nr:Gfo/Idh/MocA family oxidoreductase [bacterium M00.F.Ca.ET.205.01.1.1]TGU52439.1 Gfo/Idh/MocA family oxidoreductase [bacterium M00.F.Ca.ET.152.01.1.1]TGV34884.1 Gfo/Idh/MocA family oxidoreductase [Mesorhizobium sp. M00.F.Ca.ET.186.01.1.1]TGZ42838.1 Gfo/Idh/MocA family oxidoreductase [bacterium M00.F.Ca.ET.162.01.1.1]TJW33152.1 MAG: Gfo/Idh/MocA family oxidoreductase [Mesorhizobium sp.]